MEYIYIYNGTVYETNQAANESGQNPKVPYHLCLRLDSVYYGFQDDFDDSIFDGFISGFLWIWYTAILDL